VFFFFFSAALGGRGGFFVQASPSWEAVTEGD